MVWLPGDGLHAARYSSYRQRTSHSTWHRSILAELDGRIFESIEGYMEPARLKEYGGDMLDWNGQAANSNASSLQGSLSVRQTESVEHAALASEAETEGVSLNQLVLTKLALHLQSR
jgi:hypothetical protein